MKFIVDFYRGLDAFNLILFWGVIIVIILLLIFSILLANKNHKLKQLLIEKEQENKKENEESNINIDIPIASPKDETINIVEEEKEETIEEEKDFVAEEHVIEYNEEKAVEEISNKAYQKNVLREISSNQTSPIGIIKKDEEEDREIERARELQVSLNDTKEISKNNESYLQEVSQKLSEAVNETDVERTPYELKEEEDAIISYDELMRKRNNLNTLEDEDAIISIEELIHKKQANDKLYNLTEDEANDEFINELKQFRNDL